MTLPIKTLPAPIIQRADVEHLDRNSAAIHRLICPVYNGEATGSYLNEVLKSLNTEIDSASPLVTADQCSDELVAHRYPPADYVRQPTLAGRVTRAPTCLDPGDRAVPLHS